MKNQEKPASFINKLYNILKSKQHSKAIAWDSQAKGIRIFNQKKLEETVLPRYFRHNRFSSFVRQLNMYDFHKVHLGDQKSIFCHEVFDLKDKETLYLVKRKLPITIEKTGQIFMNQENLIQKEAKKSQKSIKSLIAEDKQNIWSHNSSFRLIRHEIWTVNQKKCSRKNQIQNMTEQQAIQKILREILPFQQTPSQTKIQIKKFKRASDYRRFFKQEEFKNLLYQRLGIQFDGEKEDLSQLSIEEQLLIQTPKIVPNRSLRLLESGPINYRDTIGCLMNF